MARFTSPILSAGSEPPSAGLCWAMSTPGVWKSTWWLDRETMESSVVSHTQPPRVPLAAVVPKLTPPGTGRMRLSGSTSNSGWGISITSVGRRSSRFCLREKKPTVSGTRAAESSDLAPLSRDVDQQRQGAGPLAVHLLAPYAGRVRAPAGEPGWRDHRRLVLPQGSVVAVRFEVGLPCHEGESRRGTRQKSMRPPLGPTRPTSGQAARSGASAEAGDMIRPPCPGAAHAFCCSPPLRRCWRRS